MFDERQLTNATNTHDLDALIAELRGDGQEPSATTMLGTLCRKHPKVIAAIGGVVATATLGVAAIGYDQAQNRTVIVDAEGSRLGEITTDQAKELCLGVLAGEDNGYHPSNYFSFDPEQVKPIDVIGQPGDKQIALTTAGTVVAVECVPQAPSTLPNRFSVVSHP